MKAKMVAAACVGATLAVLVLGYSSRAEQPVTDPCRGLGWWRDEGPARVQRQADHEKDLAGEQDKINGELARLNQEVETEQAKLKTFKAGTPEHLELYKSMVEKQGKLQALQEYYRQSASLREKQWTEQFFKEILDTTNKIAEQKAWPGAGAD